MSTHVLTFSDGRHDTLRGTLLLSVGVHALLFVILVTYTMLGFHLGGYGREWGSAGAVRMGAVATMPGIPLPTPLLTTPSTVATQNPSPYKEEPKHEEEPPPDAQQIPKFKNAVKLEKLQRVNKHIQKTEQAPPDNAIPTGLGGAPTMTYTQVVTPGGPGGFSMGEGNSFGLRYGYYVAAMRSRISANWLLSTVSPNIVSAPRLYLTFKILRDGSVTGVEITQSSGIAEVDRSALRAILASNPLPPLPTDYSGSSLEVEFYFDFHRQ
jgi:TonB family protein